jgi:hypothetical protein
MTTTASTVFAATVISENPVANLPSRPPRAAARPLSALITAFNRSQVNHLAISVAQVPAMTHRDFHATIPLPDHHLRAPGPAGHPADPIAAVHQPARRRDGAARIGVAPRVVQPPPPGWMFAYPPGAATPSPEGPSPKL